MAGGFLLRESTCSMVHQSLTLNRTNLTIKQMSTPCLNGTSNLWINGGMFRKQHPTVDNIFIKRLKSHANNYKTKQKEKKMSGRRGFGRGTGGARQGIGGPPACKCPKCEYTVTHSRGTPCTSLTCPECGSRLIGST
jgi:hypothetical protein